MTSPQPPVPPAPRGRLLCAPWATPGDLPEQVYPWLSPDQWAPVLMQASELLYLLSGERWKGAGCTTTVLARAPLARLSPTWGACGCWHLTGGSWWPRRDWSPHVGVQALELPSDEVSAVTEVRLGTTVLAADAYRREGQFLVRDDGRWWPLCTDPVAVTYDAGLTPPESGVRACVTLAIELAKRGRADQNCAPPSRTTQVTRQGVSVSLDPDIYLRERRTGIASVDLWLKSVNPSGARRRAEFVSLDVPRATYG